MTPYILVAGSLVLATLKFFDPTAQPTASTVTGNAVYFLSYGFTPAIVGLIFASIKWTLWRLFGKQSKLYKDWYWIWGLLLAFLAVLALMSIFRR